MQRRDLFAVAYRNVPGKGLFASGGLKFQEEAALRREYGRVVERMGLEALIGEAAVWVLWPSTAAIWIFPWLLWLWRADAAVLASVGVFLVVQAAHMLFYARWLNYVGFVLANRLLQAVAYLGFVAAFWAAGSKAKAAGVTAWLVLMALGAAQVVFLAPFVPLLKVFFRRSPADQALMLVAKTAAGRP